MNLFILVVWIAVCAFVFGYCIASIIGLRREIIGLRREHRHLEELEAICTEALKKL